MEFKINVYNSPQGDITILDLSKEYNQYLDENDEEKEPNVSISMSAVDVTGSLGVWGIAY